MPWALAGRVRLPATKAARMYPVEMGRIRKNVWVREAWLKPQEIGLKEKLKIS
jgi:hypothetical protein